VLMHESQPHGNIRQQSFKINGLRTGSFAIINTFIMMPFTATYALGLPKLKIHIIYRVN